MKAWHNGWRAGEATVTLLVSSPPMSRDSIFRSRTWKARGRDCLLPLRALLTHGRSPPSKPSSRTPARGVSSVSSIALMWIRLSRPPCAHPYRQTMPTSSAKLLLIYVRPIHSFLGLRPVPIPELALDEGQPLHSNLVNMGPTFSPRRIGAD